MLTKFRFTCSGQVAVIIPRQVTSGLVGKRVKVIAVAKHHTVISTDGGEVYTWGSNRGWFLQASCLPWNLLNTSNCGKFFTILRK